MHMFNHNIASFKVGPVLCISRSLLFSVQFSCCFSFSFSQKFKYMCFLPFTKFETYKFQSLRSSTLIISSREELVTAIKIQLKFASVYNVLIWGQLCTYFFLFAPLTLDLFCNQTVFFLRKLMAK